MNISISRRSFLHGAISTLPALAVATHCSVGTLIAKGAINPKDYLYLDRDGVCVRSEATNLDDCSDVFQLAIDMASHTGGGVCIPHGEYKFSVPLVIT